ncbi:MULTISPECIES: GntR family transcriptional regulator [unclassified Methylophilus]|uniref:GntR family transcriptional regulator n=1 Tax=unclassified Methylophilus TaxID=2630143 RepID=UPI001F445991|nr:MULTISPECIES: GntR family transcriptional regulator [unclassified Methylophilus]
MMHDYDELIARLKVSEKTSEPYYQQLKRNILTLIETGAIENGSGLPSERMLAEALNLSRTTVRRCYEELRASGQIDSDGRAGTLVKAAPKICPSLGKLKGFTEEMREVGITASTRIVSHEVVTDRTIASIFQRPSTSTFLRLIRIRLGNEVPMTREVAWYDLTLAPGMADWDTSGSAYNHLEQQCGIKLSWAEQSIEAVMSSDEESRVFDFRQSSPCLLLKRKSYSQQQQLVEYVEGTFRGDAYTYRIKLEV